jgi:hypothetical protein
MIPDFDEIEAQLADQHQLGIIDDTALTAASPRSLAEVARSITPQLKSRKRRWQDPRNLKLYRVILESFNAYQRGTLSQASLAEIMSTSDFPILFGDVLDRRLLNQYTNATSTWRAYAQAGTVPDFRQSRIIAVDGLQTPFTAYPQPENADLKYDDGLTETGYVTSVSVYARGFAFSWRMMVNRALNFLTRVPTLLGNGAIRTEERLATALYVGAGGPDATFFSNTNKNLVNTTNGAASNNPPLSVQGLKDALNVMYRQVDTGGDPIEITGVTLLVPPALQITAAEILRAISFEITPATTAAGIRVLTPNWASGINPVVNWYLPLIDATANKHTTWYLFADPRVGRPALEVTHLDGYDQPMLYQKAPNSQRVGGGIDPMMGDFDDMSMHYKCLAIVGGALLDPKGAVVSNGSGA